MYWQRTPSESGQDQCEGAHPYSEKWYPIYRVSVLTSVILPLLPGSPYTRLISSNVLETRIVNLNALVDETTLVPTIVPMVLVDAY